jgi:tripartite-type tricarboxylate transporter receptor subunit TctC
VKELIALAKARPGEINYASSGNGSTQHLTGALFCKMAGIEMTHIPYRGASPAFADLVPGRVDCYFGSGALLSYARSGQVRVLGTTAPKRDAAAPDVPTIAESGIAGYDVTAWQALFMPARTPAAIIRKVSADTNTALADPEIKDKLAKSGYVAEGSSPQELEKLLKSEIVKWSTVIKSVGIKID